MKNENLLKLINDIFDNIYDEDKRDCGCPCCDDCECDSCKCNEFEKLDLTNDEDYEKFNKYVEDCKSILNDSNNSLLNNLFKLFEGVDVNKFVDDIKKAGDEIHKEAQKKKVPKLPSSNTPINKQLQIHKLVGEYVDTIIKPNTNMSKKTIDDAYAGLFEFACWLMNK